MKYPKVISPSQQPKYVSTWNNKEERPAGPYHVIEVTETSNPDIFVLKCENQELARIDISHRPRDIQTLISEWGDDTEQWGYIDLEPIHGTTKLKIVPAKEQHIEEPIRGVLG